MGNKNKEPSLLRRIVEIHHEQATRRKALRILNKQQWSVEFLEYLVKNAAQQLNQDIVVEIESPSGHKLRILSAKASYHGLNNDNDIFNKLDDQTAVEQFISDHAPVR